MLDDDDSSTIGSRLPEPIGDYPRSAASTASTTGTSSVNTSGTSTTSSTSNASSTSNIATPAQAKLEQNAAIVQASLDASISSKNQPLALLLKTAITGINDLLKPQFGENAIQAASASGQDNSATGTADRIVSLSTGFFEAYKTQNPGKSADEVLTSFMATIRKGFETGYQEAQGILKGMGVLDQVSSAIETTHGLVDTGYTNFEAAQRQLISDAAAADATGAKTTGGS
jgi:hypothetical protein